jgi:hypothetical protein
VALVPSICSSIVLGLFSQGLTTFGCLVLLSAVSGLFSGSCVFSLVPGPSAFLLSGGSVVSSLFLVPDLSPALALCTP